MTCHEAAYNRSRSLLRVRVARNLRYFGKTKAPSNGAGRRQRRVAPQMLNVLCEHLLVKPGLHQDEIAVFLYDEFGISVKTYDISMALKSIGWSKKVTRQVAKKRNDNLRDYCLHNLSRNSSTSMKIAHMKTLRYSLNDVFKYSN